LKRKKRRFSTFFHALSLDRQDRNLREGCATKANPVKAGDAKPRG